MPRIMLDDLPIIGTPQGAGLCRDSAGRISFDDGDTLERLSSGAIYPSAADFPPPSQYPVGPIREANGVEYWNTGSSYSGDHQLTRERAIFAGSPQISDESILNTLTTWLGTDAAIGAQTYTSVLYYDPINGNDANNGLRQNAPKQNMPVSPAANTVYAIRGGTTVSNATMMNIGNAGVMLTSYDPDGTGKIAKINGEAVTSDLTRAIRIDAANTVLANLELIPTLGSGSGRAAIFATALATNLRLLGLKINTPDTGVFGRIVQIGSKHFTIEGCNFSGGYNQLSISGQADAVPTNLSRIRFNKFDCSNSQTGSQFLDDGDAITFDGINAFDWAYKLIVSDNEITGFHENACDLNKHSRLIVLRNDIHQLGKFQVVGASALMLGSSSAPTSSTGNIVLGNYIHDMIGMGIVTRGSQRALIMGNLLSNIGRGISFSTAGSRYNKAINNTMVNLINQSHLQGQLLAGNAFDAGGIRVDVSMDDTEIFNNIIHIKDISNVGYYNGVNNLTTASRIGGNIFAGPNLHTMTVAEYHNRQIVPDQHFLNVEDVLDMVNYQPTAKARACARVPLATSVLDKFGAPFQIDCAGAVSPKTARLWF